MFYPSSKHHFDTMFVILCVIAGASSHSISNTSKTSTNQLNNHHRASFIDFILDSSPTELLQSTNMINKESTTQYSSFDAHKSTANKLFQQAQTICAQLSNLLNSNQMKFCYKHSDVLETILPQVIQLTKKECARITADLKWNCSTIDFLLDRSNPLAFTKEAALVRSILNASMMYLVVKACSDGSHRSCGCQYNQRYSIPVNTAFRAARQTYEFPSAEDHESSDLSEISALGLDQQEFSPSDLSRLNAGSPLRLTKSINWRQGCVANTAFANAFTQIFIDSDESRALNKAHRILNEDLNFNGLNNRSSNVRRLVDSDYKDLAYIKWTKSAINLHNNHIGRQIVRGATRKRCRCHGLSGVCQFQTCWDQLLDFDSITSRLRSLYLFDNSKVEVKNLGTFERPDLCLARAVPLSGPSTGTPPLSMNYKPVIKNLFTPPPSNSPQPISSDQSSVNFDRVKPDELLYLYESPDYCEPQLKMRHPGTRGRACALTNNVTTTAKASKKRIAETAEKTECTEMNLGGGHIGGPGSCEELCCKRGYQSQLVLEMVTCNCRFKFCCHVDCEHCLHQRMQHYCL